MQLPLIGVCDNDINLFETAESATRYMEPWDVDDGLWRVWGADGLAMTLLVQEGRRVEVVNDAGRPDAAGLLETGRACGERPRPSDSCSTSYGTGGSPGRSHVVAT